MPEHSHFLIQPSLTCDLLQFIGQIKNLIQRAVWSLGIRGRIWQRSFHDRFLRRYEAVIPVVRYILSNPVRRGLVKEWRDYPFSGSLEYDIDEIEEL